MIKIRWTAPPETVAIHPPPPPAPPTPPACCPLPQIARAGDDVGCRSTQLTGLHSKGVPAYDGQREIGNVVKRACWSRSCRNRSTIGSGAGGCFRQWALQDRSSAFRRRSSLQSHAQQKHEHAGDFSFFRTPPVAGVDFRGVGVIRPSVCALFVVAVENRSARSSR